MKDFTNYTLGQLLTHESQTIRRLAGSILKLLQRQTPPEVAYKGINKCNHKSKCNTVNGKYCLDCHVYL